MPNDLQRIQQANNELKQVLLRSMATPCIYATAIEGFHLVRREDVGTAEHCFERPLVGLVVQGTKHSIMGGHEYTYTENECIVAGVDMPISSYVIDPTPEKPFLFLYLYLDKQILADLSMEMQNSTADEQEMGCGVSIAKASYDILEMFLRLVALLEKPDQIPVRAPMMLRELHYLLLISPHGTLLRQLNTAGTKNNQVFLAIDWLRQNYKNPLKIDFLARRASMSTSNLHRQFKSLTGLSPLQYHKHLRLHEAKRLMLVENERVSDAALNVGYESVTQFNREYKRLFGEPPLRDMNRRREQRL